MTLTTSFVSHPTLPCTVAPMTLSAQLATTAAATMAPAALPSACVRGDESQREFSDERRRGRPNSVYQGVRKAHQAQPPREQRDHSRRRDARQRPLQAHRPLQRRRAHAPAQLSERTRAEPRGRAPLRSATPHLRAPRNGLERRREVRFRPVRLADLRGVRGRSARDRRSGQAARSRAWAARPV